MAVCSLGRSVSDDSLYNMDETSQKLKYFVGSQADGINAGDVAFLAGSLIHHQRLILPG